MAQNPVCKMMSVKSSAPFKLFSKILLGWYNANQRPLPWRKTQDPYAIWLSEIMLQQTQVATVIPYYHRFLKLFPDIKSIANAPEQDLLQAWAGLGYYNRIRQFQKAAQKIAFKWQGRIPSTKEELQTLPGLGDYTAAAVASIAFCEPVAVVDGNVMRVLSRLFCYSEDISKAAAKKYFQEKALSLLDPKNPGDFNQAMMELGATLCTPQKPKCLLCPVQKFCKARNQANPENFPVKLKKTTYVNEQLVAFVFQQNDAFFLRKRTTKEIMPGMWEFPLLPCPILKNSPSLKTIQNLIAKNHWPASLNSLIKPLKPIRHTIMNRRLKIFPFLLKTKKENKVQKNSIWISKRKLSLLPLTTITKKIQENL